MHIGFFLNIFHLFSAFNTVLPPQARGGGEGGGPGACPSPPTGSSSGSRTPTRYTSTPPAVGFSNFAHWQQNTHQVVTVISSGPRNRALDLGPPYFAVNPGWNDPDLTYKMRNTV